MTNLYKWAHKDGEVGQVAAAADSDVIRGCVHLATFGRPVAGTSGPGETLDTVNLKQQYTRLLIEEFTHMSIRQLTTCI